MSACASLGVGRGSKRDTRGSGKTTKTGKYLKHLAGVLSRKPSKRLVVMGDFNQKSGRRLPGSEAAHRASLLQRAIPPQVTLVTCALETIDHIALSADMEVGSLDVISNIPGERELSDRGRFGVVAHVSVRSC